MSLRCRSYFSLAAIFADSHLLTVTRLCVYDATTRNRLNGGGNQLRRTDTMEHHLTDLLCADQSTATRPGEILDYHVTVTDIVPRVHSPHIDIIIWSLTSPVRLTTTRHLPRHTSLCTFSCIRTTCLLLLDAQ